MSSWLLPRAILATATAATAAVEVVAMGAEVVREASVVSVDEIGEMKSLLNSMAVLKPLSIDLDRLMII